MRYLGNVYEIKTGKYYSIYKNNEYYLIENEKEIEELVKKCFNCSYYYLYSTDEYIELLKEKFRNGYKIVLIDKNERKIENGEEWENIKRGPVVMSEIEFEKLLELINREK